MNKYRHIQNELRAERFKKSSCDGKQQYKTEEQAKKYRYNNNIRIYKCDFCGFYHRTHSTLKTINLLKK